MPPPDSSPNCIAKSSDEGEEFHHEALQRIISNFLMEYKRESCIRSDKHCLHWEIESHTCRGPIYHLYWEAHS